MINDRLIYLYNRLLKSLKFILLLLVVLIFSGLGTYEGSLLCFIFFLWFDNFSLFWIGVDVMKNFLRRVY